MGTVRETEWGQLEKQNGDRETEWGQLEKQNGDSQRNRMGTVRETEWGQLEKQNGDRETEWGQSEKQNEMLAFYQYTLQAPFFFSGTKQSFTGKNVLCQSYGTD